ncbi:hypothetical protein D3C76_946430 [compost metagenome]
MGFVDDDRVVAFEKAVVLGFSQQDAVGHQLDQGVGITLVLETHLVTNQPTKRRAEFFGDTGGDAARSNPAWLGMGNQAMAATPQLKADLRQLGGLARAGLTGDDQHLVLGQRLFDLVTLGCNGQAVVVTHGRHALLARGDLGAGGLDLFRPLGELGLVGALAQLMQLPTQTMAVGDHGVVDVFQELVDGLICHGAF